MSGWRELVKSLHAIGGEGSRMQFDKLSSESGSNSAIERAKELRLVERVGGGCASRWRLTALGRGYCEGTVEVRPSLGAKTGGRAPAVVGATWLASLPRDIRIEQKEPA